MLLSPSPFALKDLSHALNDALQLAQHPKFHPANVSRRVNEGELDCASTLVEIAIGGLFGSALCRARSPTAHDPIDDRQQKKDSANTV
jgi:hypothetical protein